MAERPWDGEVSPGVGAGEGEASTEEEGEQGSQRAGGREGDEAGPPGCTQMATLTRQGAQEARGEPAFEASTCRPLVETLRGGVVAVYEGWRGTGGEATVPGRSPRFARMGVPQSGNMDGRQTPAATTGWVPLGALGQHQDRQGERCGRRGSAPHECAWLGSCVDRSLASPAGRRLSAPSHLCGRVTVGHTWRHLRRGQSPTQLG